MLGGYPGENLDYASAKMGDAPMRVRSQYSREKKCPGDIELTLRLWIMIVYNCIMAQIGSGGDTGE